ncbi:MAG: TauD/TfdA dioxygenase family protein [Alphaproteobacteria bacterium]
MTQAQTHGETAYETIEVTPITGLLGAEIAGVDLARPLDNHIFAEIHRAFLAHHVLLFRDQTLTTEQQAAFGRRFGTLNVHPYIDGLNGHPEVFTLVKEKDATRHLGNCWHSDVSYAERPTMATMLYAIEVPQAGGDTMFTNMHAAYDALSPGMKRLLDGLQAEFSAANSPAAIIARNNATPAGSAARPEIKVVHHPVVRTHPETGRKALYVNPVHTVGLKDMTAAESRGILEFLYAHSILPEFTCRLHWTPGALALWDNRSTMHYAVNDFSGHRREMRRVTVDGDRPF